MTRQAYIAELSQLLFYMTAWDKAEVLEKYSNMFEACENEAALIAELGTPMKLAVTLHRSYEPTPEPTAEELAAKAAEKAAEEAAAEEVEIPAEEPEEAPVEEAAEELEEAPTEEAAEESEEAPVEEAAEEPEEAPVEEATEELEEAPVEEAEQKVQPSMVIEMTPGKESIFAEIFNAATEAQSAVVIEEEKNKVRTEKKARYWFLIPYTILAVLVAIPVELCLIAANVALAVVMLLSFVSALYLGIFHFLSAPDLATKLIVGGMAVVLVAVMIGFATLTIWFFRYATTGFLRFLREVADRHGYREVEVQ